MQISTRFAVSIHILLFVEVFKENNKVTSDFVASSVKTNPVVIRKLMSKLKDAGLINIARGTGGIELAKPAQTITLLDIYEAVEATQTIPIHKDTELQCPVGGNIENLLTPFFNRAVKSFKDELNLMHLSDLLLKLNKLI